MKEKIHYLQVEAKYFEDFVISSLRNEKLIEDNKDTEYDAILTNGIPKLFNNRAFLEIKFANNKNIIDEIINKKIKDKEYFCLIGMFYQENIINENYAILGIYFIRKLAEKYPALWWNFISCVDNDAQISISEDLNEIVMDAHALGSDLIPTKIKIEEIYKISDMNAHEFKRLIKYKKPSMIVGNGISIPFGSDSWSKMIDSLFDYLSPYYLDNNLLVKKAIGDSNYFAASMSKNIIDKSKYDEALRLSIYRKYENKMHNKGTLLHSVAQSKIKFPQMPLITYNYDSFLENDLKKFNPLFQCEVVHTSVKNNKTSEPKIMHVHGYCNDKALSEPKDIILTIDEYYKAYKGNNWVVNVQKAALKNNICLYVGSSMSDIFQLSLINDVYSELNSDFEYVSCNGFWKCFALMCLKGLSAKDILTINNYYLKKGIRLIFVDDYNKLSSKLNELMGL